MAEIRVQPGELEAGSGRQTAGALDLLETAGEVTATADSISGAAGHGGAAAAGSSWGGAWPRVLGVRADAQQRAAANLTAAAAAYQETDEGQIRR